MNERIRQLLNEATVGLEPDLSPQRTVTLNELEKFAELIVLECSKIVLNCGIPGSNTERDFIVASREIKHHFGVEE